MAERALLDLPVHPCVVAQARRGVPAALVQLDRVAEVVSPPGGLMLVCGMSIGFEDPVERHVRIDRAPLAETVTFLD
jgi:hypothetical protein